MTVCRDLARHRGAGTKHENDQRKSDKDEQSCHYQLLDEKRPGNMSTVVFKCPTNAPVEVPVEAGQKGPVIPGFVVNAVVDIEIGVRHIEGAGYR